ncbi:MAG: 30S ribosomal protein S3ae [Candidatus Micrarchaeota archaeon]|nr:30S ribosomal protein S3ae [Candidatus Micrarchaeota archaeon]
MADAKKTRLVDKWKTKQWYSVVAPEFFDSKEIGQIVSSDEANLKNRVIKVGLGEMSGTFSPNTAYTNLFFRVKEVVGKTAKTAFIGHELMPGYIRTLARRRRSVINQVDDVTTKDGIPMRIKMLCITGLKVSQSVKTDVRKALSSAIKSIASNADFATLSQELAYGKLSAKLFNAVKKIGPIKRVEVRKSEVKESFHKEA